MNNLTRLANLYNSDKGDTYKCAHHYTAHYAEIFEPYKKKNNLSLLEIGLNRDDCSDVPSLKMYRGYFGSKAKIFGFDIRPEFKKFEDRGFSIYIGDQSSPEDLAHCAKHSYDIVIDDGSHASSHQQITLRELWKTVKSGGVYIIEDLHWQPFAENCERTVQLAEAWMEGKIETGQFFTERWVKNLFNESLSIELLPSYSQLHPQELTRRALLVIKKK